MEIKKAWEQMKRDIKKELGKEYHGFNYGFTMNARQIENRTATFTICNTRTYEKCIAYEQECIEMVRSGNYGDKRRAEIIKYHEDNIKFYEGLRERFGNRENEVAWATKAFENSKAFEKFQNTVGKTTWELETKDNGFVYGMRFHY